MDLILKSTERRNALVGIILGFASFLLMLIEYHAFYRTIVSIGTIEGNASFMLLLGGIILAIRYRKKTEQNRLTFRQGLITGLAVALWSGATYSLLSYLYVIFMNPQYVDEMLLRETFKVTQHPTAAETVGGRLIAELTYRPLFQLVGKFFGSLFIGLVISSIVAFTFSWSGKKQAT